MLLWNIQLKRKVSQSTRDLEQRNKELQSSERNYREIFNATSEMIFLHDGEDSRILDCNDPTLLMLGYNKEELLGKSVSFISAEAPSFSEDEALYRIKKAVIGGIQIFEWLHRKKTGETFWTEVSLKSSNIGNEKRVLAVVRDISERKKAEEALRESEAKYRLLIDHSSDLIWNVSAEGIFTYTSPSWKRVTGYEPSSLVGASFESFVHPEDIHACFDYIQKAVQTKEIDQSPVYRVMHADGTWHWHLANSHPVVNPAGEFVSLVGISRDITKQKQTEDELRQEQLLMNTLLDSLPGIFYLYSYPALRLLRWNKNHEILLGFGPGEIKNRSILDWHVPEAKESVLKAVDLAMENGMNMIESPLLSKDGHYVPFLMTGAKLEVQGQSYLMGVGIDITERKQIEQEREKTAGTTYPVAKDGIGRAAGGWRSP